MSDLGFTQAATVVERIRAYGGQLFATDKHLERWHHSASVLHLHAIADPVRIQTKLDELLSRNQTWIDVQEEFGALLIGTPGVGSDPTLILDLYSIDRVGVDEQIASGSALWITDVQQPSNACWPRSIKVRSRLHYFLADQQAGVHQSGSLGVLLDQDGTVTETSIANLILVEDGDLIAPAGDQILPGVSLGIVRRLAEELGHRIRETRISPQRLCDADEVLLTGTRSGIWFANRINGQALASGPVYNRLRMAFDRLVTQHTGCPPASRL